MKMSARWLYAGAVLASLMQTGVLYASIEQRASILRSGKVVELLSEPVDPRDLLRGDYVVLDYAISSIARSDIAGKTVPGQRDVYVALKPGANGLWHFSRASLTPLADLAPEEVQIHGKSRYDIPNDPERIIRIHYGIERFYLPEGQGRAVEDAQRDRAITVMVAVNRHGEAVIKALKDNGKQLFEEPLY
ncbi:GDYXXLXY domain-containing protein [Daeguia caeni]|uniref:GDYXXLXY domain-containing protein n=1 Tax=Daeguia caeni TaxID=439612 RepID=A0ABV9H4A7_9HYPH